DTTDPHPLWSSSMRPLQIEGLEARVVPTTFASFPGSPVAVGTTPRGAVVADFNGDGRPDLAIGNAGSNNVSILLNNGNSTFTPATGSPVAAGLNPRAVAAGDLNGDGHIDIVTANASVNTLSVLLGNGDGTFTPATGSPIASGGSVPFSVVLAD